LSEQLAPKKLEEAEQRARTLIKLQVNDRFCSELSWIAAKVARVCTRAGVATRLSVRTFETQPRRVMVSL
jgi:hypothetical protein